MDEHAGLAIPGEDVSRFMRLHPHGVPRTSCPSSDSVAEASAYRTRSTGSILSERSARRCMAQSSCHSEDVCGTKVETASMSLTSSTSTTADSGSRTRTTIPATCGAVVADRSSRPSRATSCLRPSRAVAPTEAWGRGDGPRVLDPPVSSVTSPNRRPSLRLEVVFPVPPEAT